MTNRIRAIARLSGLALLFSGVVSASPFTFGIHSEYDDAPDSWPDAVVVGDVSGDGRADVVMATGQYNDASKDNHLFIRAQTPQGTLTAPLQLPYLGMAGTYSVLRMQMADLNNDGMQDVVVGHHSGITVFIARGQMRFSVTKIDLPGSIAALSSADLNRDGSIDVVRQGDDGALSILLGDGTGAFPTKRSLAATTAWHQGMKIGDVTGDGLQDMVFTNQLALTIYPGKGTGDFMPPRVLPYPLDEPRGFSSVAIADINHDGRNDVLTTTSGNPPNARIWLYTQTVDGFLSQPQIRDTYSIPEALTTADLDHNGYADIITMHGGWYRIGYYLQGRQGFAPELGAYVPYATHYSQDGLALGDINGDGCTDAAVADYNQGLVTLPGYYCYEPWAITSQHDGDFDGDGKADILWHNAATGANSIWKSGNSATPIPMQQVADTNWTIAGIGDFNGDGKADVLWHHVVTGTNTLWHSGDYQQSLRLRVTNRNWEIVGVGDFDGNGNDDILWRHKYSGANAIWEGGYYTARNLTSVTNMDWKVVGVADFDGNGKADILWRNSADGRNALWRNADYHSPQAVTALTDVAWQVAGVGDFDNDGHADILWRQAFDGRNTIWHSADSASSRMLTRVSNLSWKVSGIGDYAHDGRSDVLWRDSRTGANSIWRDANSTTAQQLTPVTNMNWKIMR